METLKSSQTALKLAPFRTVPGDFARGRYWTSLELLELALFSLLQSGWSTAEVFPFLAAYYRDDAGRGQIQR